MKDESGFTLMETLCAIAILLICAGIAGGFVYNSRRIADTVSERSVRQFRQLRIEKLIREAAEEVSVPYWAEDVRGVSAARQAIEKSLSDAGYKTGIELETIIDQYGRIRGVTGRCLIEDQEYEGRGLFSSVALREEK